MLLLLPPGDNMCLVTFRDLCSKNVAAADYIALAKAFHTVFLQVLPSCLLVILPCRGRHTLYT